MQGMHRLQTVVALRDPQDAPISSGLAAQPSRALMIIRKWSVVVVRSNSSRLSRWG
jgi:hypothetical protein